MKNAIGNCRKRKEVMLDLALPLMFSGSPAQAMHRSEIVREVTQQNLKIVSAKKINPTTIEVLFSTQPFLRVRDHQSESGERHDGHRP